MYVGPMYACMYTYVYVDVGLSLHTCMYTYIYVCVCMYVCIHVYVCMCVCILVCGGGGPGADPGFLKGGVHLRSTSKKRGGSKRGSNFGPNVKKPTSWPKGGGPDPLEPPPPGSATGSICTSVRPT